MHSQEDRIYKMSQTLEKAYTFPLVRILAIYIGNGLQTDCPNLSVESVSWSYSSCRSVISERCTDFRSSVSLCTSVCNKCVVSLLRISVHVLYLRKY